MKITTVYWINYVTGRREHLAENRCDIGRVRLTESACKNNTVKSHTFLIKTELSTIHRQSVIIRFPQSLLRFTPTNPLSSCYIHIPLTNCTDDYLFYHSLVQLRPHLPYNTHGFIVYRLSYLFSPTSNLTLLSTIRHTPTDRWNFFHPFGFHSSQFASTDRLGY